jgi:hypothetical protein
MSSLPRLAPAVAALALLATALTGCGSTEREFRGSTEQSSTAGQLADQAKEGAGPAERAYMDQHRRELEAATGIELPIEHDEPGGEEAEYGEDGQPAGEEEGGEAQQEYDESGEPVEARS